MKNLPGILLLAVVLMAIGMPVWIMIALSNGLLSMMAALRNTGLIFLAVFFISFIARRIKSHKNSKHNPVLVD